MKPTPPPLVPGPPPVPEAAKTPWRVWHFVVVWLGGLVGSMLALPFTSITLTGGTTADLELTGTDLLAISLPAQLIGHLVALAILVLVLKLPFEKGLGFDVRPRDGWFVFVGVALSFAVSLAMTPLAEAVGAEDDIQGMADLMQTLDSGVATFVAFLAVVVVTPMVEEIMFRGIFQRAVGRRWSTGASVGVTAVVFALAHIASVPAENFAANASVTFVSILIVGLVLSWLVARDGRLGRAIALHTGFNLVSFVVLLGSTAFA